MSSLGATAARVAWFARVMRGFVRARPVTTAAVVGMAAVARITKLLAFFIPLKVILLAGSEGVPRYFQFFIRPEQRDEWILGLSLLAVACYILTLLLEALSARLSLSASREVLQGATQLVVLKNQGAEARDYYARFCEVCADAAFLSAIFLLGLLVNSFVFGVLLALLVLQAGASYALAKGRGAMGRRFERYLEEDLGGYLKILSGANFFLVFVLILLPFLLGVGGNLLIAILSVIMARQGLNALIGVIRGLLELFDERHKVEALVFPRVQYRKVEGRAQQVLREFFGKPARQALVSRVLGRAGDEDEKVEVRWADSTARGVCTLPIDVGAVCSKLQLQVFPQKSSAFAANEDLLFRYMTREALRAPELVARFDEGPFRCQIVSSGPVLAASGARWRQWAPKLTAYYWGCRPPRQLIKVFTGARELLHKRLSDELVGRLAVALDTEAEAATLAAFQRRLPEVRRVVKAIPLFVRNPDLNRLNVVECSSGGFRVVSWGRWTLEPLGAAMPPWLEETQVADMLEKVKQARDDVPAALSAKDLMLAAHCWRLDAEITGERYKGALARVRTLMELLAPEESIVGSELGA